MSLLIPCITNLLSSTLRHSGIAPRRHARGCGLVPRTITSSGGSGSSSLSGLGSPLGGLSRLSSPLSRGGSLGCLGGLLEGVGLLGLLSLFLAVDEHINHHVPLLVPADHSTEAEDLTAQKPPQKGNALLALVVAGDGNIDELHGRVAAAHSDGGDVHVGSLHDGLVVQARVSDDQKARLDELLLDLVGEGTRGEASSDGLGSGVLSELEHSTLAPGASADHAHISGVVHSSNSASSEHELLPRLVEVDDVETVVAALEDVALHLVVEVAGTGVDRASEKLGDVLLGGGEAVRNLRHGYG
mmetsp:Transcript_116914/g.164306  ORF Transcript_116914/g.164306 Transcript_116914/m.164306 type:complete len:300 (+) Transcript_116914:88-987(+)